VNHRLVITIAGGPGAGKTRALALLEELFIGRGATVRVEDWGPQDLEQWRARLSDPTNEQMGRLEGTSVDIKTVELAK
jgi:dephospho-CoA kinase